MSDRILTIATFIVAVLTLFAVVAATDGEITQHDAAIASAFVTGVGLTWILLTGRRPKE